MCVKQTCVDGIWVVLHPLGHCHAQEEGEAKDEEIAGRVEIHVLKTGYAHGHYQACNIQCERLPLWLFATYNMLFSWVN